jgi:MraZ protein
VGKSAHFQRTFNRGPRGIRVSGHCAAQSGQQGQAGGAGTAPRYAARTADADRCLLIYPLPDWELIQQKLEGLSNLDSRVRELQRRLIGFAVDVDMDGAGRVLISPALRQFAELEKNVVLVGQGKKFELWNQEHWEQLIDGSGRVGAGGRPPQREGFSL